MKVIVVNPVARQLRRNIALRGKIHTMFGHLATIIDVDSPSEVIDALTAISATQKIEEIYLVGGDGTFNLVLNWVAVQPKPKQSVLMSVGGGQFCYMCRWHGFRSTNPLKNLRRVLLEGARSHRHEWRPLLIHDTATGNQTHAALVANGIISDIVEWYVSVGKGGFLTVVRIVILAALSVVSERIRRTVNKIKLSKGIVRLLDSRTLLFHRSIRDPEYAGIVLSAIPELLASCRPFRGTRKRNQFFAVFYQNGLRRLACAAPFVWFGKQPFWIASQTFNQPVKEAVIGTSDNRLLVDGELLRLSEGDDGSLWRTLTITAGDPIHLLRLTS